MTDIKCYPGDEIDDWKCLRCRNTFKAEMWVSTGCGFLATCPFCDDLKTEPLKYDQGKIVLKSRKDRP